ncbi:hypothetical protein SEQ_HALENA_86 [Mycobacterium phage Halena]|uniref:Uncharacterized protein n=7 Tax=Bronvirus TaxID=1623278 RepID=A0A5Q2W9K6_9CAUD|nr:hypothetical protein FGG55_gp090 [Mycobacterium phage JoeDirt]YP_010101393.1 hypothetical protein KNU48_gp072 [Mycobacterium phage Silverleaf]YP_010105488.1 hypothetical protein KNU85_gp086 [Mycobacterium phage DirkDirk]YP_010114785.1 hypothetical protein KNV76_gp085 [Mycobacterium phage OhShagHennessy]ASR86071.1 hypothetical protein SEA_APPLETREE2_88 [Mycobacterium phage Appletree2]AYD82264.1 hypothetical protein SEA_WAMBURGRXPRESS_88 [Mycobacterium phage Wamburgrxpress]QBP29868.1 hypothe
MSYTLFAASSNGLALVTHKDGEIYRYNLGRRDGVITYENTKYAKPFTPDEMGGWELFNRTFSTARNMQVWWQYDRSGGRKPRDSGLLRSVRDVG